MNADAPRSPSVTLPLRSTLAYQEPKARRAGYTEPALTLPQHTAVLTGSALVAALANRPLVKLEYFSFLADVPGEGSRIVSSDKRAHFFRVLFSLRWWEGPSVIATAAGYGLTMAVFLWLRSAVGPYVGGNTASGYTAGALTGVVQAVVCQPFDVLRATADAMRGGPRPMRGPGDVLWRALRERPAVLAGLYKGISVAVLSRSLQCTAQYGTYNALRYDGVYRHSLMLFIYCHIGVVTGFLLQYPVLSLRQQLHALNQQARGTRHTYRSLLMELRRRHGLTKVYDGFFVTRPFLRAIAPALFLTLYDIGSRRYTEYLDPGRRRSPDSMQSLTTLPARAVQQKREYEFAKPAATTAAKN